MPPWNPNNNNRARRNRGNQPVVKTSFASAFEESLSNCPPDSEYKVYLRWNHTISEYEVPFGYIASRFNEVKVEDLGRFIGECKALRSYNVAREVYRPSKKIFAMQCSPLVLFGIILIALSVARAFQLIPFLIVPLFFMVCGMTWWASKKHQKEICQRLNERTVEMKNVVTHWNQTFFEDKGCLLTARPHAATFELKNLHPQNLHEVLCNDPQSIGTVNFVL
jgi:hypothetical protein